jgi:hypothetical protein
VKNPFVILVLAILFGIGPKGIGAPPTADPSIVTLPFQTSGYRWETARDSILISDPVRHQVHRISLFTGEVLASWTAPADRTPEAISVSPDGRQVAVALTTRPHSDFWMTEQRGFIALLNPTHLTEVGIREIPLDPWDLAVLDDGNLVVSGGSGQWTSTILLHSSSNTVLGTVNSRQRSYLIPVPGTSRVYLSDTDSGPATMSRLEVHSGSPAATLELVPPLYRGEGSPRTRPVLASRHSWMLRPEGVILGLAEDRAADFGRVGTLQSPTSEWFKAAAWDPHRPIVATLSGADSAIRFHHAETFLPIGSPASDRSLDDLAIHGERLIGLSKGATETTLWELPYPVGPSRTNQTPEATLGWSSNPTVDRPVRLEVLGATDDGGPEALLFAWDIDGDGLADVPFTAQRSVDAPLTEPGIHRVALWVRDYWGALGRIEGSIDVGPTTNRPPVARFAWDATSARTTTPVTFDASLSSDDQLPGESLRVRWDWESDGIWDTEETNSVTARHWFHEAGRIPVTLQVRDNRGAVSTVTQTVEVTLESDSGTRLTDQAALDLPFPAAAMWVDARRGFAYFTDPIQKRLVRVPLENGRPDREWRFEFPPDALAANEDGSQLFVSELVYPRSSFNFGRQAGLIAVFDPGIGEVVREFSTPIDPAVLLPLGDSRLLVGGGSSQLTYLLLMDVRTGRELGRIDARESSPLIARTPDRILLLSNGSVDQVRIGVGGSLVRDGGISILPQVWGPWAKSPAGTEILSANGYLFDVPLDAELPISLRGRIASAATDGYQGAILFDRSDRLTAFRAVGTRVDWLETASWTLLSSIPVTPVPRFLGLWNDRIVAAGEGGRGTRIQILANPAVGAETNRPPVAHLQDVDANAAAEVTLDASGTTDDLSPPGERVFRWDWEGDGIFDTGFSTNSLARHRYFVAGTYHPRVQVRDRFGALDDDTIVLEVVSREDPGIPGVTHTPGRLGFQSVDVGFDARRSRAYASTGPSGLVVSMDLVTGLELRRWSFPWPAEQIAVTPDSQRLYVALPSGPHLYAEEPPHGRVAEFDLERQVLLRVLQLENDPWDLAVTDDGILFVSPGSNQFAPLDSYRLSDGVRTGRVHTRFVSRMRLNPEQDTVWVGTTDSSPRSLFPLYITRPSGGFEVGPAWNGDGSGVSIHLPLPGYRLLDSNGRIVSGSNPSIVLSNADTTIAVQEAELLSGNQWIAASTPAGIRYLNLTTSTWLPWAALPAGPMRIGNAGTNHAIAMLGNAETLFITRSLPATDAERNRAPIVTWPAGLPGAVAVPGSLDLSVAASDPDGMVTGLELWSGTEKVSDIPASSGRISLFLTSSSTNRYRVLARDNFGAIGTSPDLLVIGSRPPVIQQFLEPAVPAFAAGIPLVAEVSVSDPDGPVQRVDFILADGTERLVGTATQPPWRTTVPGLDRDTDLVAIAYDSLGVPSAPVRLLLHRIGERGDDFYAPWILSGSTASDMQSNVGATLQPFEPSQGGSGNSVWWRWTAPSNGVVVVSTVGSGLDTLMAVYSGSVLATPSRLTTLGSNNDTPGGGSASRVKFRASAGTAYRFQVDSAYSGGGSVQLNLAYESLTPLPPPNDLLTNRFVIPSPRFDDEVDSAFATRESFEPLPTGIVGGRSVWWEWTAPSTGSARVTTEGSQIDTVLSAFTSLSSSPINFGSLTGLGSNDDIAVDDTSSRLLLPITGGRRYFFAVDSYGGIGGMVRFHFTFLSSTNRVSPTNDAFAAALPLDGAVHRILASTHNATAELREPLAGSNRSSIWWRWTAPRNSQVFLSTETSSIELSVYTGNSVTNLTQVTYRQGPFVPGRIAFHAVAGRTYSIRAASAIGVDFFLNFDASLPALEIGMLEWVSGTNGAPGIRFRGPQPVEARLQSSETLTDWTDVVRRTWTPGEMPFPIDTTSEARFYRLMANP